MSSRTPDLEKVPDQSQVARFVGRHVEVRGAEEERLVALVGAAFEQVGRLGVRAGDDDAGDSHDVELEAGGVQPLVLLVLRDQHLAALVAAFLGARALVFEVVAGDAGLHEAADQVPHVRVAAVPGVGVGDDERAEVVGRRRGALRLGHPRAQEVLVPVRGE